MKPEVDKVVEHYRKISGVGPAVVEYVDAEAVNSLEELLEKLKGQKYYVDLWATWCGPCKEEFQFNESLNELLEEKGYKKLYISIDKQSRTKKWKQDIDNYNLSGLHVIANQELASDISQNHAINSIPYYLIINESGEIAVKNAPRPSDLEELEKML